VQAFFVAASGPNVRSVPLNVYEPLYALQPPDPDTVPAAAKIAVTVEPATGDWAPPLPLLMLVASQRVSVRLGAVATLKRIPTLPSVILSSRVSPVIEYEVTFVMAALNAVRAVGIGPQAICVEARPLMVRSLPLTVWSRVRVTAAGAGNDRPEGRGRGDLLGTGMTAPSARVIGRLPGVPRACRRQPADRTLRLSSMPQARLRRTCMRRVPERRVRSRRQRCERRR
jgi:hypothetical protein